MRIFIILGTALFVFATTSFASAKCKMNLGKQWRNVGAGSSVKAVCKKQECGGKETYVILNNYRSKDAGGSALAHVLSSSGRKVGSPLSGWTGYGKEIPENGFYVIREVYVKGKIVGNPKVAMTSIAAKLDVARKNLRHAKARLKCN